MNHSSHNTPIEIYHGVPEKWDKESLVETYFKLNGKADFNYPIATEPGAPSWLPDRFNWLQYRAGINRIVKGVKELDEICIEIGIRYLELNYFGSYSGYLKSRILRALKKVELSSEHISRIRKNVQKLENDQKYFYEYSDYKKLLSTIND